MTLMYAWYSLQACNPALIQGSIIITNTKIFCQCIYTFRVLLNVSSHVDQNSKLPFGIYFLPTFKHIHKISPLILTVTLLSNLSLVRSLLCLEFSLLLIAHEVCVLRCLLTGCSAHQPYWDGTEVPSCNRFLLRRTGPSHSGRFRGSRTLFGKTKTKKALRTSLSADT